MKVIIHNVFEPWPLEDKSVQTIITSPPYWSLRKYDIPDVVIGGHLDCEHKFRIQEKIDSRGIYGSGLNGRDPYKEGDARLSFKQGFCMHCNAWKGQHGLEPTYQLYIEHVRLWAKEAYRVLRDDGIMFLNLGDSYGGSWGNYGAREGKQRTRGSKVFDRQGDLPNDLKPGTMNSRPKCKLLIPHRVAIVLIDDGWILRNDIIWNKPNTMPESCQDRFSKKFEYIFMFSKSQKYYFDLDAVREETITNDNLIRDRDTTKLNNVPGRSRMGGLKENNYKSKNPGDVWTITTQPSPYKHYAMWPEQLVERMILCSTKAGDTVLDPFAGSGTTLKVAEQLQREGIGFDLGYKDIQKDRLRNVERKMFP